MKRDYSTEIINQEQTAKALLVNQPASRKYSVEIAREIRGKKVSSAEKRLQKILEKKEFLPLRRFNKKVAHRKGNAKSNVKSGRYPQKTVKIFRSLLGLVKANADYKGLDSENLLIEHIAASEGFSRVSYQSQGRIAGKRRKRKSTNLEIVVRESK